METNLPKKIIKMNLNKFEKFDDLKVLMKKCLTLGKRISFFAFLLKLKSMFSLNLPNDYELAQ